MKKVIIGIHGLNNKPKPALLSEWWRKSIADGLEKIGIKAQKFDFEMVYWADHNYGASLDEHVSDIENELYLGEPYLPPADHEIINKSEIKKKFLDIFEKETDNIFLSKGRITGIDKLVDSTVKKIFKDLDNYYNGYGDNQKDRISGPELRNRLNSVLQKYKGYRIFLIAHSMGSIIAYDTLQSYRDTIEIDTFATIGSPLGLAVIIKKILWDLGLPIDSNSKVPTPENITGHWFNFSDLNDKIAINYNLADDFSANSKRVKPIDFQVINDYIKDGVRNPHKGYGYLRTKELAEKVFEFLQN